MTGVILDDDGIHPVLWEVIKIFPDSYLLKSGTIFRHCYISDFWQLV